MRNNQFWSFSLRWPSSTRKFKGLSWILFSPCWFLIIFFPCGDFTPNDLGGGCCSKEFGLKFVFLCVKRFVRDFYFLHDHDLGEFWFRCWCCSRSSRNEMLWEGQKWEEIHPFHLLRCSFHLSIQLKRLILFYAPSGAAGDCPRFALGLSVSRRLSQPWSNHRVQGAGNVLGAPWAASSALPKEGKVGFILRILMDLFNFHVPKGNLRVGPLEEGLQGPVLALAMLG